MPVYLLLASTVQTVLPFKEETTLAALPRP